MSEERNTNQIVRKDARSCFVGIRRIKDVYKRQTSSRSALISSRQISDQLSWSGNSSAVSMISVSPCPIASLQRVFRSKIDVYKRQQLCCALIMIFSSVPGFIISAIMLYSLPFFLMSPIRTAIRPPFSSAVYCFIIA